MIIGFLLTISYKSVLCAMMMRIYYDEAIDTLDDMLASGQTLLVARGTIMGALVPSDPRTKVKMLTENVEYYNMGRLDPNEEVFKGIWER